MTITPEEVARLAAAATPGPWHFHEKRDTNSQWSEYQIWSDDYDALAAIDGYANVAFIASAHDMAALIAELEAKLAKAVAALTGVREFVKDLEPYAEQGHSLVPALQKACTALREITGEKQ